MLGIKIFNQVIARLDELIIKAIPNRARHKQASTILKGGLLTVCFMAYYLWISYLIDFKVGMIVQAIVTIGFSLVPLAIAKRVPLDILGNLFVLLGFTGIVLLSYFSGGLESPILPWISLVPIVGLLFVNRTWVWIWFGLTVLSLLIMIALHFNGHLFPIQYHPEYKLLLFANCMLGLVFTILFLNMIFEYSLNKANRQLENNNIEIAEKNILLEEQARQITEQRDQLFHEKQKSDELLLNILPEEVAQELKTKGNYKARLFDNVSILFTDFVSFTTYSEHMNPTELIEVLHYYFQAFDSIIEKHGLEKIKTIGDAYMAVSGLPHPDEHHAEKAVRAAKEIQTFIIQSRQADAGHSNGTALHGGFQARIGIHSGPVIAGIVGTKKFVYDIWGDTVNTAARIEQSGVAQKISISGQTYELIKDHFTCEFRGKVTAKNKGELEMYFVH